MLLMDVRSRANLHARRAVLTSYFTVPVIGCGEERAGDAFPACRRHPLRRKGRRVPNEQTDCLVWLVSCCRSKRRLTRSMAAVPHSIVTPSHNGKASCDSFSVWLKRRFSVPACDSAPRRAQWRSRLTEGHRGAAQSGLGGRKHGAMLPPGRNCSRPSCQSPLLYLIRMAGLPPAYFSLDYQ
jgi:hypothetical protein